ncbi:MAG: patatin-like phospholipase family protein [Candidatus Eiseniibacteriota bacterium]|jgi:predicted patatin/cPLA2 family phospholipase
MDDALKPVMRHLLARRDAAQAAAKRAEQAVSAKPAGAADADAAGQADADAAGQPDADAAGQPDADAAGQPEAAKPVGAAATRDGGATSRFDDGRRIGLVVQGGAMRGVFTAGALCGLEELGLRDCFDVAFGASGGAINIAYLLAGQVFYGTSIYYSDINNNAFIDFRRFAAGNAVDIDYCFDEVIGRRKRLDLERVLAHPTELRIVLTDVEAGTSMHVRQHDLEEASELLLALKASAAMPLVYRRHLALGERRVMDGAYLDPVPLDAAIAAGCTDVVVLLTRPRGWRPVTSPSWVRAWVHRSLGMRNGGALNRAWAAGLRRYADTLARLELDTVRGDDGREVNLAVVAPPATLGLSRFTRDRARLVEAATEAARRVHTLGGVEPESLRPFEAIRVRW